MKDLKIQQIHLAFWGDFSHVVLLLSVPSVWFLLVCVLFVFCLFYVAKVHNAFTVSVLFVIRELPKERL